VATGALALIPLALASSASAAAIPPPQNAYHPAKGWAGYVVTMPASQTDQFGYVAATFTIPKVTCSDSTESGYKIPKGDDYSAVAFWVGLGGATSKSVEQGGIEEKCATRHSAPKISAWEEMYPSQAITAVPLDRVKLTGGHGAPVTPRAGDSITVSVQDLSTGTSYKPGQYYRVQILDETQNTSYDSARLSQSKGNASDDRTAEVVTEAIDGGPWNSPQYTGIAHFQPVSYSGITVGLNGGGYTWGIGSAESWTSALWYVHSGPVGGLLGTLLFRHDHTLISTGGLSKGGHAFINYWHKY
jgi:Peptidase A4 family